MPRIVVFARCDDRLAVEVTTLLRRRIGADAVQIVSDEELVLARRWTHHVVDGCAETVVELFDGEAIDSRRIDVVLNRLPAVPGGVFEGTPEPDRSYALSETHALWLSWLAGLPCPVLNPATPRGLCAPELGPTEWLAQAAWAGLPARRYRLSTNTRRFPRMDLEPVPTAPLGSTGSPPVPPLGDGPAVFAEAIDERLTTRLRVIGDAVLGPLAAPWGWGLRTLARTVGCDLLEVLAAPLRGGDAADPERWRFCGASGFLSGLDPEVVSAVADLLLSRATLKEEVTA